METMSSCAGAAATSSSSVATPVGTVRIRSKCVPLLEAHRDRVRVLFSATLAEHQEVYDDSTSSAKNTVFNVAYASSAPLSPDRTYAADDDFLIRLQVHAVFIYNVHNL